MDWEEPTDDNALRAQRCLCGGKADIEANGVGDIVWVFCKACDTDQWGKGLEDAVARWNARVAA